MVVKFAQSGADNGRPCRVRVAARGYRHELVRVTKQGKVSAFAAHVRDGKNYVRREFLLHVEVPLLHVGPDGLVGNGINGQRKEQPAATDVAVSHDVNLR